MALLKGAKLSLPVVAQFVAGIMVAKSSNQHGGKCRNAVDSNFEQMHGIREADFCIKFRLFSESADAD